MLKCFQRYIVETKQFDNIKILKIGFTFTAIIITYILWMVKINKGRFLCWTRR